MMEMNVIDRSMLRLSAALLLAGQLSYVVITLFHTGGEANHHAEIFAAYADSRNWTAVVLAIDGVALKQAVNAWANAPVAEQAARSAAAESMRWLEWGARSYENFALGFAVMFAAFVVRSASLSRAVVALMMFSSITYFWQGWLAGSRGFSEAHTTGIVLTEILNAIWMTWLLVIAWRMPTRGSTQTDLAIV